MTDYASIKAAVLFVVADNDLVRQSLCDFVKGILPDWMVIHGGLDEQSISAIGARSPDAILVDLALPHTDGVSIIRKLKTVAPSAPIIALTMDDDEPYLDAVRSAGSTFCLPIWELRHKFLSVLQDGIAPAGDARSHRRIVCVEDDLDTLELIRFVLERHSYVVIGALGGHSAHEIILKHNPDLVLLDLMMPGVNGWEVYEQMKADERTQDIPVIVITVLDPDWMKVTGSAPTALEGYVAKPFNPRVLLAEINKKLSSRTESVSASLKPMVG
jgi:DNA-binding response OmpR family regulator